MKYVIAVLGGLSALVLCGCWASLSLAEVATNSKTTGEGSSGWREVVIEPNLIGSGSLTAAEPIKLDKIEYQGDAGRLHSPVALVYDLSNQTTVLAKNTLTARQPASLAKIMTVLLAIEHLDLGRQAIIQPATLDLMRQYQASTAGFLAGETVSVEDLLYGALLASGGEASYELALAVSGNQDKFVELMNWRAQELEMTQTYFHNPIGLDRTAQQTSAEDLRKLLVEALKNATFRRIFTTSQYRATSLGRELIISSTLFNKLDSTKIKDFEIIGGKTGTTGWAGLCLASLVRKDQHELLVITMGASLDNLRRPTPYQIEDLRTILADLN